LEYSVFNKEHWEDKVSYRLMHDEVGRACEELVLAAWRGLGCRDGGRVDVRMDAAGRPNFIEVNPLAGLHPTHSDLPMLCRMGGMDFTTLIGQIVDSARQRLDAPVILPGAPRADLEAIRGEIRV
jgi:D-alanine-D-alanine ligase